MIPNQAHFVWFGKKFSWMYALGVRSAALLGGFERAILHHADDLEEPSWWNDFVETEGVELRRLTPDALLEQAAVGAGALVDLYRKLDQPAAQSNLVRLAILFTQGGVYLDTDTVTLASLEPLLGDGMFCGVERIVYPHDVIRSRNPLVRGRALLLDLLRKALRRMPEGYALFNRVQGLYPEAANNAAVGAEAGHPMVRTMLERALEMSAERQLVRYALGTHLLQEAVKAYPHLGCRVHPPEVFFPLGPEISEHWFRSSSRPRLDRAVSPETRVVHWYASVRTRDIVPQVDPEYIRRNAHRQLFSALVASLDLAGQTR